MTTSVFPVGVRIAGIASVVPNNKATVEDLCDDFGVDGATKIASSVGVNTRFITEGDECTSDLCVAAAKKLLENMDVDLNSIDCLIFVTQTPDYVLPATSCMLQHRIGLSSECASFDVNLGCSGYTYGLWLASCMINSHAANKVLLLAGDTISKILSSSDRSVVPLFGDAGTATLLERSDNSQPIYCKLGTDGSGAHHLKVPAGGFRNRASVETLEQSEQEDGYTRNQHHLKMDGSEIFSFTLKRVPAMLKNVLSLADWGIDTVDAFVFHQANKFMLNYLRKKMKIEENKLLLSLYDYGNTSSASIPLTICSHFAGKALTTQRKMLLSGFGVGFSWASICMTFDTEIVLPDVFRLNEVAVA